MALIYLLDTNVLSELIRQPSGAVQRRIALCGEETICTSIVVACELRFGAQKRGSPLLCSKVDQVLANIEVLPLDTGVDRDYAILRFILEKSGTPIGPNDLLIAAHARSLGLVLVTANVREFERVPDLLVENWLLEDPR
jgi:tRNA(fMet)-specific endonuclease VapC